MPRRARDRARRWIVPLQVSPLLPLLIALALPGSAPVRAQAAGSVFGEVIDVRVVNVEAVVRGPDGAPLHGLGRERFELLVDGREVPIDYFSEVREGLLEAERTGVERVPESAPPSDASEPRPTHYLLFIDDSFLVKAQRNAVLKAIGPQLAALRPGDEAAVVAFDGRYLEFLSGWTGERSEIAAALAAAAERKAHGGERLLERRRFESDRAARLASLQVEDSSALTNPATGRQRYEERQFELEPEERDYAARLAGQMESAAKAAASAMRAAWRSSGRKVALVLAGSWPFSPANYAANDFSRLMTDSEVPGGGEIFATLVDSANRLGYTLYPVDVPGVTTGASDVEQIGPGSPLAGAGRAIRELETHGSLEHLAEQTGGRALLNTARLAALERVVADTGSYYWLGFTAPGRGDDARHAIEVAVDVPGAEVRTRRSYLDLSSGAERAVEAEGVLFFENAPGSELAIEVGKGRRAGRGEIRVPLTLALPLDTLTFLPSVEGWVAEAELRITTVDAHGDRSEVQEIPLRLALPSRPRPRSFGRYRTEVTLRRIRQELGVVVTDPLSGRRLWGRVGIEP